MGFIIDSSIDKVNLAINDKTGFIVTNFKHNNCFIFTDENNYKTFFPKFEINVTNFSKDLPSSKIILEYNDCKINYKIDNNAKLGYYYCGNIYVPNEITLLRYSKDGIVTEDYIKCRISIIKGIISTEI